MNWRRGDLSESSESDAVRKKLHRDVFIVADEVSSGCEWGHSIFDVAPTLLARAGIPLPAGLDGAPIPLASPALTA